MPRHSSLWFLTAALALAAALPACGSSSSPDDAEYLTQLQAEIYTDIEAGHEAEPIPTLSRDELEELEVRMHRLQVAGEMRASVVEAMEPLAFASALFAPDGAVELMIAVVPGERLSEAAVKLTRKAFKVRRNKKRAQELAKLHDEFQALLDAGDKEFLRVAGMLTRKHRQALTRIMERTQSPTVVRKLMDKEVKKEADVTWIARKLERKRMDGDLVERFTFDAGVVEDITKYDANISWKTLQLIVEGGRVDEGARAMMAIKLRGLMGERAAREIVTSRAFRDRYLQRSDKRVASGLGMDYGSRYGDGSMDIVAYTQEREAVFVEVKAWSADTWSSAGRMDKLFAQLRRHDAGIDTILANASEQRTVAAKVLMVEESGLQDGLVGRDLADFENRLASMGWVLETIPSRDVPGFADIIDGLR